MRLFLALVAAFVVPAIVITFGEYTALKQFGFEYDGLIDGSVRIGILAVATGFGILIQILTSRLKRIKSDQISIVSEFKLATSSRDFWLAVLLSPFVLAAAYNAIAQVTSLILVATIGFQNGFFFHSIVSRTDR